MKTLVLVLEGVLPDILFNFEKLINMRRLMTLGCYGRLKGVIPSSNILHRLCMATSKDPGTLGIYSNHKMDNESFEQIPTLWTGIATTGKGYINLGVPTSSPTYEVNSISIGGYLTPEFVKEIENSSSILGEKTQNPAGDSSVDKYVNLQEEDRIKFETNIFKLSQKQFQVVRNLLLNCEWDFLQVIDVGLDDLQHAFGVVADLENTELNPANEIVLDYYLHLDQELGLILELLPDDITILLVSTHSLKNQRGGFAINEWLAKRGDLVIANKPSSPKSLSNLSIDWTRTKAWAQGENCSLIYLNLVGREPTGVIAVQDYKKSLEEIKESLEAIENFKASVIKPEEIYQEVNSNAPDLIICTGDSDWQILDKVGYGAVFVPEQKFAKRIVGTVPEGFFTLFSSNNPLKGEIEGCNLLDISPTLLELGGYDIPHSIQGKSWVAEKDLITASSSDLTSEDEEILRERLSGLGYI